MPNIKPETNEPVIVYIDPLTKKSPEGQATIHALLDTPRPSIEIYDHEEVVFAWYRVEFWSNNDACDRKIVMTLDEFAQRFPGVQEVIES